MMLAAAIKLLIQLPLTIAAAVNRNVVLLTIAAIAGGTSTGGNAGYPGIDGVGHRR